MDTHKLYPSISPFSKWSQMNFGARGVSATNDQDVAHKSKHRSHKFK